MAKTEVDFEQIMNDTVFHPDIPQDGAIHEYKKEILISLLQASADTLTVVLDNAKLSSNDKLAALNMRTSSIDKIKRLKKFGI